MGFMKMLAQNTQIDGRSRWDDAERMLRDDPRFKAVPDSSDREDLFSEFVEALTKKEKVILPRLALTLDVELSSDSFLGGTMAEIIVFIYTPHQGG